MPNTKVTRQRWKDHLVYAKKVYIIGALIAGAVASFIFSVTRYVPPNEKAVLIELVDTYADTSKLESDIPHLLAAGKQYDESLEEVSFLNIPYAGESTTDYTASQVYTVQVYAGDNDIFFQNEELTLRMINEGYAVPLETLAGFDAFNEKYGEYVVWQAIENEEEDEDEDEDEDENNEPEEIHAYSVDISSLLGINQRGAYDVRGKYALIVISSANADTSFAVLSEMFDYYQPAEVAE